MSARMNRARSSPHLARATASISGAASIAVRLAALASSDPRPSLGPGEGPPTVVTALIARGRRRRWTVRLPSGPARAQATATAVGAVVVADALARLLGIRQRQATAGRAWRVRRLRRVVAAAAIPAGRPRQMI